MLGQVKADVKPVGMYFSSICDLEHGLEADALLPNIADLVLFG